MRGCLGRCQARKARAINSGPWSLRICVGQPRCRNNSLKIPCPSRDGSRRRSAIARHSLVYPSTNVSLVRGRPSCVRSITKSYDQTWFGYSARRRIQEPSAKQSRARLGCVCCTFSPASEYVGYRPHRTEKRGLVSKAPPQLSAGTTHGGGYLLRFSQIIEMGSGEWTHPQRVILIGDFRLDMITLLELSHHLRSFICMQTHFPAVFLFD